MARAEKSFTTTKGIEAKLLPACFDRKMPRRVGHANLITINWRCNRNRGMFDARRIKRLEVT